MNNRKTNRLVKKMNGYQKANRDRFLLLAFGELTQEELLLYEFCIAITDWDKNHDNYGTFEATNQEIAEMLRWKANSSVSRYKRSLIDKGFLEISGSRVRVKDFEKWELRKTGYAKMQNENASMQGGSANMHDHYAKTQGFSPQNNDHSLGSYKGNVGFPHSEVISDEELDRISEEIDKIREGTPPLA